MEFGKQHTQRTFARANLLQTCLLRTCYGEVANLLQTCLLRTCYGEVANLLQTCYGETGVMDFGFKSIYYMLFTYRNFQIML